MNDTVEMIVTAVAVVAFVTYRQTRWQSVRLRKLLVMPVVLAVVGVVTLVGSRPAATPTPVRPLDLAVIGAELALGLAVGWLMGRLTEIQVVAGTPRSRLRPAGVAVWLGFIAVRIAVGVSAAAWGSAVAAQPGGALLVIAVVKGFQALVIRSRVSQHQIAATRPPAYVGRRS